MCTEASRQSAAARPSRLRRLWVPLVAAALLAALVPGELLAQPFNVWLQSPRASGRYISVAHNAALNPTSQITLEVWASISLNPSECVSLIGKDYLTGYWLGVCNTASGTVLRSYLRGGGRAGRDAGVVPTGQWTHLAVTFDGTTRRHYINGEQVGFWTEPGPLATNSAQFRIGSDVSWNFNPNGSVDEVRVWNVARTQAQLRSTINVPITAPQPGLVAVWGLNASPNANVGGFAGTAVGSGLYFTFPALFSCGSSTGTFLCLDSRFSISARYRVGGPGTAEAQASVVPFGNPGSGLFYFFDVNNWEIMVKAIDACGLNNRHWIFSAATTTLFYRLEAFDVRAGVNKIYFNYPGAPALTVTDTDAFATCP